MLTSDAVALWGKGMDAWWSLFSFAPDPLLPIAYIAAPLVPPAARLGKSGTAFITTSVPPAPAPRKMTEPVRLGGAETIVQADLTLTLTDGTLEVKITGNTSPGLVAGLYQGLAYVQVAPKNVPLAVILVQFT